MKWAGFSGLFEISLLGFWDEHDSFTELLLTIIFSSNSLLSSGEPRFTSKWIKWWKQKSMKSTKGIITVWNFDFWFWIWWVFNKNRTRRFAVCFARLFICLYRTEWMNWVRSWLLKKCRRFLSKFKELREKWFKIYRRALTGVLQAYALCSGLSQSLDSSSTISSSNSSSLIEQGLEEWLNSE